LIKSLPKKPFDPILAEKEWKKINNIIDDDVKELPLVKEIMVIIVI